MGKNIQNGRVSQMLVSVADVSAFRRICPRHAGAKTESLGKDLTKHDEIGYDGREKIVC